MIIGFRGGTFTGFSYNKKYNDGNMNDQPHLAATYTCLAILKVCGYKFDNNYSRILSDLKLYQNKDGSISAQKWDTEHDPRFVYCACVIHKILDVSNIGIDKEKTVNYLLKCNGYEGGFSMDVGGESNGSYSFKNSWCYILFSCIIIPFKWGEAPQ